MQKRKLKGVVCKFALVLVISAALSACSDGSGLERPIKGGSTETFSQTMKQLEQELSAAEYRQFRSSLNYLQLNALEFDTIEEFYQSLDGQTPRQLIDEASRQRQAQSSQQ